MDKKQKREDGFLPLLHKLSSELTFAMPLFGCAPSESALGAVIPQLEGGALGLVALAHVVLAAAHLNLVEGTVLILVVGAAVDGTLDAGIGLVKHLIFLLLSPVAHGYAGQRTVFHREGRIIPPGRNVPVGRGRRSRRRRGTGPGE